MAQTLIGLAVAIVMGCGYFIQDSYETRKNREEQLFKLNLEKERAKISCPSLAK